MQACKRNVLLHLVVASGLFACSAGGAGTSGGSGSGGPSAGQGSSGGATPSASASASGGSTGTSAGASSGAGSSGGSAGGSCQTSSTAWQSFALAAQSGRFEVQFDATPGADANAVIGLSNGLATGYTSLAAIVRFNAGGDIDACDGGDGNYAAATAIPYAAGESYHFRLDVDIPSHSYDIRVTPPGASEQVVGTGYAFRVQQSNVATLDHWAMNDTSAAVHVCNFALSAAAGGSSGGSSGGGSSGAGASGTSGSSSGGSSSSGGASTGSGTGGLAITSPANGSTVDGYVTVTGTAASGATQVAVQVDGGPFMPATGTTAWSYAWNTAFSAAEGTHTLTARATDSSGSTTLVSIGVNVNNQGTPYAGSSLTDCAGAPGSGTVSYSTLDACGYPSPNTTGVPGGTAWLTPVDQATLPAGATWTGSELDITGDDVTVSGLSIVGGIIRITGTNDTVVDCYVNANGNSNGGAIVVQDYTSVGGGSGANALIQDSEVEAPGDGIGAVHFSNGLPAMALRLYVHDSCTGVLGLGTFKDSYLITDTGIPSGCHVEPVYIPGGNAGSSWTGAGSFDGASFTNVQHCTALDPQDQTAAIFLDNHAWGPNANVTLNYNLVAGGDYPIYGDTAGDGSANIVVTNNRWSRLYYSGGGSYGACGFNDAVTTFTGNLWDDTLALLTLATDC